MDGACCARFTLHLRDLGHDAPDVGLAFGSPTVGVLAHRRSRRNWIDDADFVGLIGNPRDGLVAVDRRGTNVRVPAACRVLHKLFLHVSAPRVTPKAATQSEPCAAGSTKATKES